MAKARTGLRRRMTPKHARVNAVLFSARLSGIRFSWGQPWVHHLKRSKGLQLVYLSSCEAPQELSIPVIYSRECVKKHMMRSPDGEFEEGVCPLTMAKEQAMKLDLGLFFLRLAFVQGYPLSIGEPILRVPCFETNPFRSSGPSVVRI